ncbi:hypothetical protein AWM79_00885 [Pseudomonas agarici]|uniref:Uncharacterized protein n=1 Tax=Pseudomonas agarici TaxID=46677 RepID=A0A0X8F510_PSEAA|nr:hypothetical protein AWM79_00885 [Pseudomonas agarici]SEK79207.1 hypothetical protein SAMN05216604_106242 [Pseudomonas agarici]
MMAEQVAAADLGTLATNGHGQCLGRAFIEDGKYVIHGREAPLACGPDNGVVARVVVTVAHQRVVAHALEQLLKVLVDMRLAKSSSR